MKSKIGFEHFDILQVLLISLIIWQAQNCEIIEAATHHLNLLSYVDAANNP